MEKDKVCFTELGCSFVDYALVLNKMNIDYCIHIVSD